MSKAISRRDFMKVTGAVGAAGLLAACGGNSAASGSAASTASSAPAASADESLALSDGPVSMTISWWGGDSRHEAYQNAIKEFQAEHTNITIEPTFAAWSGWEEKMAAAFIAGNAQDVCQVNWNWLYNYSADGSKFVDLNTVSKFLDLTQWDDAAMDACYVANSQQCVPVSMTGRIFFWNMTTFNKAGITEVPKSLDDLIGFAQRHTQFTDDQFGERGHEFFHFLVGGILFCTIVAAGHHSQQFTVRSTVVRHTDRGVFGALYQSDYICQRIFGSQIGVADYESGFELLYSPNHFGLAVDRLRTEDKRQSSVAGQFDGQFGAGHRLHDR